MIVTEYVSEGSYVVTECVSKGGYDRYRVC